MRIRSYSMLRGMLLVLLCLGFTACDFSSTDTSTGGGGTGTGPGGGINPPGGGVGKSPILYNVDPTELCTARVVTMTGVNFDPDLANNKVNFTAGVVRVPGLPVRVDFPSDGNASNGLESQLQVRVPGGVSPGNVELLVNGVFAGASGYESCPQLMAYAIQRNEDGRYLVHQGPLGFVDNTFVRLYGIGLVEIQEVVFTDSTGGEAKIFPNTIERDPVVPGGITGGPPPTGYQSIGMTLKDQQNNLLLVIDPNNRDNVKVRVVTAGGESNELEIPAANQNVQPSSLGAAINSVKVPTGVVTGPVRIYYSFYAVSDMVNTAHQIEVEWTVDDGETWFPAKYDDTDLEASGDTGVLPGSLLHDTNHRLFPAGGALRLFTWDAPNDEEFVAFNTPQTGKPLPPRQWRIRFRIRPIPTGTTVTPINHEVETPEILYYYIGKDAPEDELVTTFEDAFDANENENLLETTASWGPPNNPGALVGLPPVQRPSPLTFGSGTEDVILKNVPQEELPIGVVDQFYVIDTDQVLIQAVFIDDNGTPDDPADDVEFVNPIEFDNPGEDLFEFHMRRLYVCPDVRVFVLGDNPLVMRFTGLRDPEPPPDDPCVELFTEETVFAMASGSFFDLSAQGQDGGPAGGDGGDGGTVEGGPALTAAADGQPGGNDGGAGGETTGAYDPDGTNGLSRVPGGPGGGGGHQFSGGDGDSGTPAPSKFQPAKGGRGGVARGDPTQRVLTGGAGGGGGGAGIASTDGITYTPEPGAPGGGGGGAFEAVADGVISIDSSARILCNGADGADGSQVGGAGGGGSGGSIVLRANMEVDVDCQSFEVNGGLHGTAGRQNREPGSGDGSPGWVRLESAVGGVPTCASLAAKTALSKNLSSREKTSIDVDSTAGFPNRGTLVIEDEIIDYERLGVDGTTFEVIHRTDPSAHSTGTEVLLKGPIAPFNDPDVWMEQQIVASPDQFAMGRGRDGELHLFLDPGIDPDTGELTRDPITGELIAIYTFDTSLGVLRSPSGNTMVQVSSADTDPGFLDLRRLVIDTNVILRAQGERPMRIAVSSEAEIDGTIDVSGFDGGLLIFLNENPSMPLPGVGGAGGPGGGPGGGGGTIVFINGDPTDKSPANAIPVNGAAGGFVPLLPEGYDQTPIPYGNGEPGDSLTTFPFFTRAMPGMSTPPANCGGGGQPPCIASAGGGAGGGSLREGDAGSSALLDPNLASEGGSTFGNDTLRWDGGFWSWGGTGGSGGGATPHVSSEYRAGISGSYLFKQKAAFAPGTGGGGGGGTLILVAQSLLLRPTGKLIARGGNAFQSIDLGGNGGAGAGGNVFIRVQSALTIENGATIDVAGGTANLPLPNEPGTNIQRYEGNIRLEGSNMRSFGGPGGSGSPGRIRIEADFNSLALNTGLNSNVTGGLFLGDTISTQAVSKSIRLGMGPGGVATTSNLVVAPAVVRFFQFGQPSGTSAIALWKGAAESLDQHGAPGELVQGIRDANELRFREFVQFTVYFLSNRTTLETESIDKIELFYGLQEGVGN